MPGSQESDRCWSVPDGDYELVIGRVARGTSTVGGGEGEFDTDPDDPGEVPLDFYPLAS